MSFTLRPLLLVEDNDDDVFIFTRAYKKTQLPHPVHVTRDGHQTLDYLLGAGEFADRTRYPLPFLMLLDLKLPFKPGLDVLQTARSRPALADLCIIVLTSSAEVRDIHRAHELGAQAYLVKPPSIDCLVLTVFAVRAWIDQPGCKFPKLPGDMFDLTLPTGKRPGSPR